MTIAFALDTIYNVCDRHQVLYRPVQVCLRCATEGRDALNVLEARIADQDDQIRGLRRQINTLEHVERDLQRAHNALVDHVRPNEDLLP